MRGIEKRLSVTAGLAMGDGVPGFTLPLTQGAGAQPGLQLTMRHNKNGMHSERDQ